MTTRLFLACPLIAILSATSYAQSYTAFDLAAGKLTIAPIPPNTTPGAALTSLDCKVILSDHALIIEPDKGKACGNIFDVRRPQDLKVDMAIMANPPAAATGNQPPPEVSVNVRFDRGTPALGGATYTKSGKRLQLSDRSAFGSLAYYSTSTRGWATLLVEKGVATLPPVDELDTNAELYFRSTGRAEVLQVPWKVMVPGAEVPVPSFEETCKGEKERAPPHEWEIWLDAANEISSLKLRKFTQIVEPNSFGIVLVRHSAQVDVQFDATATAALTRPAIDSGLGQSGDKYALPDDNVATLSVPATAYTCTMHPIAPRAPGSFQVKVKLVQGANRATALGERALDVVVVQRYAGAFRAGIAGVLGAPDQKFEARTFPGSSQGEIVRTARTPIELVLGYSLYLDGFGAGRNYAADAKAPWFSSHVGVFFGFGAASVSSGGFDFLKSLHAGLEYELSPNLSIALTGVLRRVDELADGVHVGGLAPATIPVTNRYVPGLAIVLNISPSFFRLPLQLAR